MQVNDCMMLQYLLWQIGALGIVEEILFVRYEQKDWNGKPDPTG